MLRRKRRISCLSSEQTSFQMNNSATKEELNSTMLCQQLYESILYIKKEDGTMLSDVFKRLPKRQEEPSYYKIIRNPIDLFKIQRKLKTNSYDDIDDLMQDFELLINNAKVFYNTDTFVYQDALTLWQHILTNKQKILESVDLPRTHSEILCKESIIQQQICIKFCAANKFSSATSMNMIENAFGNKALTKTQLNELYNTYQKDCANDVDLSRTSDRRTTATDEKIMLGMDKYLQQRVCIKFCVANGITGAESLKFLKQVYGSSVLSKTRTYEWFKTFKEGREEVDDLPRSNAPRTAITEENIDRVKEMVFENRHCSLRELAQELNISHESVRTILVDVLEMKSRFGRPSQLDHFCFSKKGVHL